MFPQIERGVDTEETLHDMTLLLEKKVIIKQRISSRSRTNKSTWRLLRQRKTLAEGYKRTDYQLSQNRSPSMRHQPSVENHSWMHQQVAIKISKNGIH